MQNLKALNARDKKEIYARIRKQWGADFSTELGMLRNDRGKLYLMNPELSKVETGALRINSLGLYFAELRNDELRLSMEGSALIGPKAAKNVLEIPLEKVNDWLMGDDLEKPEGDYSGYVIIRHGKDYLGCGRISKDAVLNYVGKNRRISAGH